jgi:hypothetical protein
VANGVVFVPSAVNIHPPEIGVKIGTASGFCQYNDGADMLACIIHEKWNDEEFL